MKDYQKFRYTHYCRMLPSGESVECTRKECFAPAETPTADNPYVQRWYYSPDRELAIRLPRNAMGEAAHKPNKADLKTQERWAERAAKRGYLEIDKPMSRTEDIVYVEQRVDCSRYVPECFGTCDALIVSDGILHIIDLKSGRGVKVDAEENDQLRIYALGAMQMFDFLYRFDTVRVSIYQPRLGNVQTWETTATALTEWAETVLVPAAKLAWDGKGGYQAGEHCRFCKAKSLLAVNCANRYAFTLFDMRTAHWRDLNARFLDGLRHSFYEAGISEFTIARYLNLAGDLTRTKTHG